MKLKIGLCGAGQFGTVFVPVFQRHRDVAEVYLADVMPDRLAREAARLGVTRTFDSLEALCRSPWLLLGLGTVPLLPAVLTANWLIDQLGEGHGTGDEAWGVLIIGSMIACLLASSLVLFLGGLIRLRRAVGPASPATDAAPPPPRRPPTDGGCDGRRPQEYRRPPSKGEWTGDHSSPPQ